MLAAARLAVLTGTLAAAGGLVVVDADAEPKRLKLEVGAAGPGAALDITGGRLAGRRTRVTVGGVPARVLSGNARRVRIVVPKVSPGVKRVVARSGRRRATGRLRVLAPFRGKI